MLAQYDGGILYVDSQLSELFESLKEKKLFDNSLIVLTSDHGEGLGFKGDMTLHGGLYDVGAHVPLIIKLPEDYAAPADLQREVTSLARSIDIMPTILDVLSIEPPPYISGESLLETGGDRINYARQHNALSIRTKDSKIIMYTEDGLHHFMKKGAIELYDLDDDPQESNNLYGKDEVRSKKLSQLAEQMEKEAKVLHDELADHGAENKTLDEVSIKKLKGLGYLQ